MKEKKKIDANYRKFITDNDLDMNMIDKKTYRSITGYRNNNNQLYDDDLVENFDYVVCPITHERRVRITNDYIIRVLKMDVEVFKNTYPNQIMIAKKFLNKQGYHKYIIDNNLDSEIITEEIYKFIKRNRRKTRNGLLYIDGLIEKRDYILCPVSGERMSKMSERHIIDVLKMTVDEFKEKFGADYKMTSDSHCNEISNGMKVIDEESGLTKHGLSVVKAKESLNKIGDDGLTGYARKGIKTKKTHMENIDEFGRNGYSQLASKAIIKGNQTKVERGLIDDAPTRNMKNRFRCLVISLTKKSMNDNKEILEGIEIGKRAFHIDHIYSVASGFKNKISPFVLASKHNLQVLWYVDNVKKYDSCDITAEELFKLTGYTKEKSEKEFEIFYNILLDEIDKKSPTTGINVVDKFREIIKTGALF